MGVWGQIAASVIGGALGNKAAKADRNAQDRWNQQQLAKWNMYSPYLRDALSAGKGFYQDKINQGAYQGDYYAGMNPYATNAYNYLGDQGQALRGDAKGFMDAGGSFGKNYQNLYTKAGQDNIQNAINYATNNAQPLIDAAMRDDARTLTESTLPQIGLAGTATGNVDNSRGMMAEALAKRGYGDRLADTTASIQDSLIGRSLQDQQAQFANQMNANQALGKTYQQGFGMIPTLAGMGTTAGGAFQGESQAKMDADKAKYYQDQDFNMNALKDYFGGFGLGGVSSQGGQANMYNPTMGAAMGAMGGWGFGKQNPNWLSNFSNMMPSWGGGGMTYASNPYSRPFNQGGYYDTNYFQPY
jgi:hypothetical protein